MAKTGKENGIYYQENPDGSKTAISSENNPDIPTDYEIKYGHQGSADGKTCAIDPSRR